MLRVHKKVGVFAIALIAVASLFVGLATAQEGPDTISLGISPQILDFSANSGEERTNTFRLTNASAVSVAIEATPKNFTPRGEEGAVDLTIDDTAFSLADWITVVPQTATVATGQTQDFEVTIAVPSDVEPGSHFGSVVFQTIPPEDETADALVSQEIAPVILVKVAGDTTEVAEIAEFRTEQSFYSNQDEFAFLSRIENTGNVHFKPAGNIQIKNMWGSVVEEIEVEPRNVLPASIRQLTTNWSPSGFQLGRYSATLTVSFEGGQEIRVAETSFTVFPYQTVVPLLVFVVVIIFVVFKGRKRLALAYRVLKGGPGQSSETSESSKEE